MTDALGQQGLFTEYTGPPQFTPRDYQVEALGNLRAGFSRKVGRQLLCAATGAGKTLISTLMMNATVARGNRCAFLVDRVALVDQTVQRLQEFGLPHGRAQGHHSTRYGYDEPVHVWSMQTLEKSQDVSKVLSRYQLVIYDECHALRRKVIDALLDARVRTIGLSATPFTRGLGNIYQNLVNVRTTDQLVKDGYLVAPRIFCGVPIDMEGAPVTGGEWSAKTATERSLPVVGDVIDDYVSITNKVFGGPVMSFCSANTVADANEYAEGFNAIGIPAEVVSYRDKDDEVRREKLDRFRSRRNEDPGVLRGARARRRRARGDVPDRRTSEAQGRRRRHPEARQDHAPRERQDAVPGDRRRSQFSPLQPHHRAILRRWHAQSLDEREMKRLRKPGDELKIVEERMCGDCQFVLPKGTRTCPSCGWTMPRRKSTTPVVAGNFDEYKREFDGIGDLWPHVCAFAVDRFPGDRGRARKMAGIYFKDLTGLYPGWGRQLEASGACDERVAAAIRQSIRKYMARQKAIEKWQQRKREEATA